MSKSKTAALSTQESMNCVPVGDFRIWQKQLENIRDAEAVLSRIQALIVDLIARKEFTASPVTIEEDGIHTIFEARRLRNEKINYIDAAIRKICDMSIEKRDFAQILRLLGVCTGHDDPSQKEVSRYVFSRYPEKSGAAAKKIEQSKIADLRNSGFMEIAKTGIANIAVQGIDGGKQGVMAAAMYVFADRSGNVYGSEFAWRFFYAGKYIVGRIIGIAEETQNKGKGHEEEMDRVCALIIKILSNLGHNFFFVDKSQAEKLLGFCVRHYQMDSNAASASQGGKKPVEKISDLLAAMTSGIKEWVKEDSAKDADGLYINDNLRLVPAQSWHGGERLGRSKSWEARFVLSLAGRQR